MMVIVVMIRFSQVVSKEVESVEGEHKKVKDKRMNVRSKIGRNETDESAELGRMIVGRCVRNGM